ncbi:hypothetical protein FUAX_24910 [Fulvitalea axinellae]|uniref:4-alpha-L-fucosyltransferase glycosyl transferase group 56 n=1 Tax=Fulvitalea axinellae TaxID=1182444 RepID=A0AAU9CUC0_9BACT|nr:hypothetical protein FUAX_24910 [Fulvitalea axinellae]
MIIHLATDEKFIDIAISLFLEVDLDEHLFIIDHPASLPITHVKNHGIQRRDLSDERDFSDVVRMINEASATVFHGFFSISFQKLVQTVSAKAILHWNSWGGDAYFGPGMDEWIYQTETLAWLKKKRSLAHNFSDLLYRYFPVFFSHTYRFLKGKSFYYTKAKALRQRFNSFSTILPQEEKIYRQYWGLKTPCLPFSYGSIAQYIPDNLKDRRVIGSDILIGNSATPTNNHIEALTGLNTVGILDFGNSIKINLPLNYGDTQYAQEISTHAEKFFEGKVRILSDFMPRDVYHDQILYQSRHVIMNHHRQQAVGNCLVSLWAGANLYLNDRSVLASFLKDLGVFFFCVEKDLQKFQGLGLSLEQVEENRDKLNRYYSHSIVLERTYKLTRGLLSNHRNVLDQAVEES